MEFSVVMTTSIVATLSGVLLPGDWGFFVPYLVGGISLGVLAIGSTAPGLLQFAIDRFSNVFPDYRERVLRHEAAHFLVGYLFGVPIAGYTLDVSKEHIDFVEGKLGKSMFVDDIEEGDLDMLSIVA